MRDTNPAQVLTERDLNFSQAVSDNSVSKPAPSL